MATAVITTTNSSMMGLSPGHASSHIWMQDGTQSIELSVNPTAAHLSPRRNIHAGSTENDMLSIGHSSPPHFADEGCTGISSLDFTAAGYDSPFSNYGAGIEHSPADSGISVWSPPPQPYSPETYSPCPTDPSSPPETAFMVENVQSNFPISSCQSDIPTSVMTSFTTTHPMHPQPYLPTMAPSYPSCGSLSPYPDPYQQAPPMPYQRVDVPTSGDLDAIDIIAHSNPIQYYPDYSQPTQMPHLFTNDHLVSMYSHSLPAPSSSGRSQKRPRKPKAQAQVDTSEIKDIPASAQLWEFLLKVLKKQKYSYMVSWENQKDGLFRFHDPPAFAALWGRHRNRPCMTYDKVARALRYYYKRDILEQVGGRLTYKFSKRLRKQYMDGDE